MILRSRNTNGPWLSQRITRPGKEAHQAHQAGKMTFPCTIRCTLQIQNMLGYPQGERRSMRVYGRNESSHEFHTPSNSLKLEREGRSPKLPHGSCVILDNEVIVATAQFHGSPPSSNGMVFRTTRENTSHTTSPDYRPMHDREAPHDPSAIDHIS